MKRLVALFSITLLAALSASADSVTVFIDAGTLQDHNGNVLSDGGAPQSVNGELLLLIASPTGSFTTPGAGQFVSGNNLILGAVVLGSGTMTGAFSPNYNLSGSPGETTAGLSFDISNAQASTSGEGGTGNVASPQASIATGDALALRWYDNFTLQQFLDGATPQSGYYGTYIGGTNPTQGDAWVIPGAGATASLEFLTSNYSYGDPNLDPSLGVASTEIVSGDIAVPEPSTYALLAAGFLIVLGMARRKRLAVVVK